VPLFDVTHALLEQALVGSAARQRALAANLSNANTPGYRRVDVDFHGVLSRALEGARSTGEMPSLDELDFTPQVEAGGQTRLDGSTLDIDRENAALTENALEGQALIQVLRSNLRIIETAIGARQ
jgi:flagellar basal-body rod protein FlgB